VTESLSDVQKEIQRKLGRNLLRLQQCELLLKHFVIEQEVSGPASELERIKQERHNGYAVKPMGSVVKELIGGYIQLASPASEEAQDDDGPSDMTQPWLKLNCSMQMYPENFARTKTQLSELVDLRNEMVHHFLERFDISGVEGCHAADGHLDELFQQINEHFERLRQWHGHFSGVRADMAAFMQTPEYYDFVVYGIYPGGAGVSWPSSGIVQLLREAEGALNKQEGGWTSLQSAIEYIRTQAPEQTPKKYGCHSWREVIHESKQFEVHKEMSGPDNSTVVWYRSRP